MPRANDVVEALLVEYADLMSITGGDAFRVRTYEKAARSVGGYHADVATLDQQGLQGIANVGGSTAKKILEILETGSFRQLDELREQVPAGVRQLMAISTLGPKKAMTLYHDLHIASIEELMDAIHEGRLRGVKGFGPKTEENILRGIELVQQSGDRVLLGVAMDLAEEIVAELSSIRGCAKCTYAGSLRRMADTIGDIDILVASNKAGPVMDAFTKLSYVERVIARGDTKASIRTTKGLQVDLRVIAPDVWGAALQYFTGSKAHNIRIREIAVRKGLKLSEYGLFDAKTENLIVAQTEEEVYERLGLPWIPPTLREDRGEVEAAREGTLPKLVELKDVKGDLHTHTNLTDGLAPLDQMISTARRRGYAYYAVTDHAPNLYMQRMTDEKMLAQREQLRKLGKQGDMVLLHGTELNIDGDGGVDWGPEFLDGFDIRIASVHSLFNQTKDEMTRRIVRACENPHVNVIGHPTGRQIGGRAPLEFDLDEVFAAAARTGTALEVNAFPDRLDLRDEHIMWAKRHGVKFAVDTDSHSTVHLPFMRYGVGTAQRGWLTKDDVINTWPLSKLRKFLQKGRR
ncbi:MAG TPA: DNA polymerase/3'-5' exonuclease PolX [Actinomycetota bacterium]|nr:DNA polymerase/3'-5' exonuclease PolX [Actinomycetota bacterium]